MSMSQNRDESADETITEVVSRVGSEAEYPPQAEWEAPGVPLTAPFEPVLGTSFESMPGVVPPSASEPSLASSRRAQRPKGHRFLGRAMRRREGTGNPTASAVVFTGSASMDAEHRATPEVDASGGLAGLGVASDPASLDARLISAWFGEHQVLQDVSLRMPAGQVTALIGPSGCGKSTFLRILNRMHELVPSATLAGEVLLDGDDIYEATLPVVEARKKIGMVFQKPNPFPAMSIYDNVLAGLALTGIRADRDRKDHLVETCLTKAGLWNELKDRLRAPGGGLSGGQQQRLCIARSLAVRPRVLLMDEPCSALDPTSTRVIEETMGELAREVTIVIVTHNMQQAQRVSQQCAFFLASQGQPGHIVEHGDTDAMFSEPIDPRTYDYVNGRFG
ncbi:phosphate transport system ATP-binding protein [Microbacterium sp. SORGH_AS 888]|nr:phosphate transport system ATP-binding protein [Microbacterium sp. SORGH_AS_0888]